MDMVITRPYDDCGHLGIGEDGHLYYLRTANPLAPSRGVFFSLALVVPFWAAVAALAVAAF